MLKFRNNRLVALFVASSLLMAASRVAWADTLPPEEQAFFDKHLSDLIQLQPERVSDAGFLKVFGVPFYSVKVIIKEGDSVETQQMVVARIDDKLVNVSRPGTDSDLPDFPKLMNPDFRLQSDDDAKTLQAALDSAYPLMDSDKKAEGFTHSGTTWNFARGTFFDHKLGFIFEADGKGVIKTVKFSLKM